METWSLAKIKQIAHREYWVPGALTIRGLTFLTPLRVYGPITEVTDAHGSIRSGAIAAARVRADEIGLNASVTDVILSFRIELVRRMPAESEKRSRVMRQKV
jgi:hypothetical protein